MSHWKSRVLYTLLATVTMLTGLASRRYGTSLPGFVAEYAGDTLWAIMVYFGISAVVPRMSLFGRAAGSLGIAWAIELSQLYHIPWIDAIRGTTPGGLLLGYTFLWTDLACYATGILIGGVIDCVLGYVPVSVCRNQHTSSADVDE